MNVMIGHLEISEFKWVCLHVGDNQCALVNQI